MDNLLMSEEWLASLTWVVELNEVNLRARNRGIVRRWWMRPIFFRRQEDGNRLLENIVAEQVDETIVSFLRMKKEDFQFLLHAVGPEISRMNTNMRNAITAQERLLITLRYLATGETFSSLQFVFRVSRSSISKIIKETCACLTKALRSYVKLPSTQAQWMEVSTKFEQRWNFPHAIGAIDGKHISIRAPGHSGSDYYNYKQFFSIVLLVIVDADYNFMFADAGGKGGISDGGIFRNSRIYQKLENKLLNIPDPQPLRLPYNIPVPYFLLGDKAFAFTQYCIRPFGGIHSPGSYQRFFNYRHSRARMCVENALGILCNRFQVLKGPILLAPEEAKHIVLTTVYLHNFLRKTNSRNTYTPPSSFDRVVDGNLVPGDWRRNNNLENLQFFPSRGAEQLMTIRTHMAHDLQNNYYHYDQ